MNSNQIHTIHLLTFQALKKMTSEKCHLINASIQIWAKKYRSIWSMLKFSLHRDSLIHEGYIRSSYWLGQFFQWFALSTRNMVIFSYRSAVLGSLCMLHNTKNWRRPYTAMKLLRPKFTFEKMKRFNFDSYLYTSEFQHLFEWHYLT